MDFGGAVRKAPQRSGGICPDETVSAEAQTGTAPHRSGDMLEAALGYPCAATQLGMGGLGVSLIIVQAILAKSWRFVK